MRYFCNSWLLTASLSGLMVMGLAGGTSQVVNAAMVPTPYAHWTLDETSGTTATDSSGNNRNGTYVKSPTLGVASAYPSLGTAVEFAGGESGEYVTLSNDNVGLGQINTNFTITGWVNLHEFSTDTAAYILSGTHAGPWAFGVFKNGQLRYRPSNGDDSYGTTRLELDKWYFVAVSLKDDGDNMGTGIVSFYVNGNPDGTKTGLSLPGVNANNYYIGGRGQSYDGASINGKLDDIRFYDQVLSADQIKQIYDNAVPEPGSLTLLGLGGVWMLHRRRGMKNGH